MSFEEHRAVYVFKRQDEWADPFPANLGIPRHFKNATALPFAYQGVAIWQALAPSDMATEETKYHMRNVLPNDLIGLHVDFDYTGMRCYRMMRAVVKDEHIALRCQGRIVLVTDDVIATPTPQHIAFRPFDYH